MSRIEGLDPEEKFWDELAVECGFSALAAISRDELLMLVKGVIKQLETQENKIKETK